MKTDDIDLSMLKLIDKYSFLSDPIFLFNPSKFPEEKDFYAQKLELDYSLIEKVFKDIKNLKKWYLEIQEIFEKTKFWDDFLKNEYKKRIGKIWEVIKIIEVFYNEDEQEKFDLITDYFWVDLDFCKKEILPNINIVKIEFDKIMKNKIFFEKTYNKTKKFLNKTFEAKEIKYYFEEALKFLDLSQFWKVEITDKVNSIVHWEFDQIWWKIFIPKDRILGFERLFTLLIHEIDWHTVQFTNKRKNHIYWPNIRFSDSEEFVEWYAIFFELVFENLVFNAQSYQNYWDEFILKMSFLNKEINLKEFLDKYELDKFRVFRWFKSIDKFINTKDLIYVQGLYKIIKYKNIYFKNLIKCLNKWTINESCLLKIWKKWEDDFDIVNYVKESSAYYVLKNFLKNNL